MEPERISPEMALAIIRSCDIKSDPPVARYHPKGLFYYPEGNKWVAMDNSRGECLMETFLSVLTAKEWLKECNDGSYEAYPGSRDIDEPDLFEKGWLNHMMAKYPMTCPICLGNLSFQHLTPNGYTFSCSKCGIDGHAETQVVAIGVTNIKGADNE